MRKYTWRIPVIVTVLTITGLLSALLGIGIWRVAAWLFLSVPLIIICRFIVQQYFAKKMERGR